MTEKYKIYIPDEMKTRLQLDAELFEFTKKDGSVNLNAFLKELLVNYFDQYRARKEQLLAEILADLAEFPSVPQKDAPAIADRLINTYMKNEKYRTGRGTAITLTVSGRSLDVMRSIENNLLKESSLSQYINDLFSSYLSVSRDGRERIIFRDTFEELEEAIRRRGVISFSSTSAPGAVFTVDPYVIAASKEEQCNYLLCADTRWRLLRTFRISRIRTLYTTSAKYEPDEKIRARLLEIGAKNPQSASKSIDAEVRLTDRGVRKFQLIVKNRPDVLRKDGNTYYFHWPKYQLEEYFKRFGYDAVIVSPADSRANMRSFYVRSFDAYDKARKQRGVNETRE